MERKAAAASSHQQTANNASIYSLSSSTSTIQESITFSNGASQNNSINFMSKSTGLNINSNLNPADNSNNLNDDANSDIFISSDVLDQLSMSLTNDSNMPSSLTSSEIIPRNVLSQVYQVSIENKLKFLFII